MGSLTERWRRGSADREDLVRLLSLLVKLGLRQTDDAFLAARTCLLSQGASVEDFRAAAVFCTGFPESVSQSENAALKDQFVEFAEDYAGDWSGNADPDTIRSVASDLESLGEKFGVDTHDLTQGLLQRADEVESELAQTEPDDEYEGRRRADSDIGDLQGMFAGLESDLRGL
jgi:hypothetical protein